jgi:hypothetical protein
MAQNAMPLHELQHSSSSAPDPSIDDGNGPYGRHRDSDKKRVLALVGSALSQLPIWGTLRLSFELR